MSDVLQMMSGRGKIRVILAKAFQDKNAMAAAFRSYLFAESPELKNIATKLSIQPEELSDKLHTVMQGAIYTWTEEQVKEKIADVVSEYKYIEAVGNVQGKKYHNIEDARKDFANLFKYLRIPMSAIQQLGKDWYPALEILYHISLPGRFYLEPEKRQDEISILDHYGIYAKDCLIDGKTVLSDILNARQIDCTSEELLAVYAGLKDLTCDSTLTQFDKELNEQINKINFARNKVMLQETWHISTGIPSVKEWCNIHNVPLLWIIPNEQKKAFRTLIDIQKKNRIVDTDVADAINVLRSMDTSLLTDQSKIDAALIALIGQEYKQLWSDNRDVIIAQTKMKIGNDMSMWSVSDLTVLQKVLKKFQQEKAKKEKLVNTKNKLMSMNEKMLRERVSTFLDAHPEFCDDFAK